MRKLKYHVASTVDGYIAHEDHSIAGFVSEGEHVIDYLASLKNDYEIVLMGRRTYEFGFQFGVTNPYPWMKQYVFSRTMERSPDPNVELVSKEITGFVGELNRYGSCSWQKFLTDPRLHPVKYCWPLYSCDSSLLLNDS